MKTARVSGVLLLAATVLAAAACASTAQAQSFTLDANQPSAMWADLQRPAFSDGQSLSGWLGFVGVRYKLASQVALLAGLPFATAEIGATPQGTYTVPGASATVLGNPYVGLRFGLAWQTVAVDATYGFRISSPPNTTGTYDPNVPPFYFPPAPDPVAQLAYASGHERFEAYDRSNPSSLRFAALLSRQVATDLSLHLRGGFMVVVGAGSSGRLGGELGAAGTYRRGRMVVAGGLSWTASDRSQEMWILTAALGRSFGRSTPMAFVRLPVNSSGGPYLASYVIGAGLNVALSDAAAVP